MTEKNAVPQITVTPTESETQTIRLQCCPVTLNPLEPDRVMTILCHPVDPSVQTSEINIKSYGPILLDGREVVEVHRTVSSSGMVLRKETHWLGCDENHIQWYLREIRYPGANDPDFAMDRIENVEGEFPRSLSFDYQASRSVTYRQGEYVAGEEFNDRVTGAFTVSIEGEETPCFCLETTRDASHQPARRLETFVNVNNGLVILTRLFADDTLIQIQIIR